MTTSFQDMATREQNAYNEFAEVVTNAISCTRSEALGIAALYLKKKVAKLCMASGTIRVKHGVFLDVSTLQNALTQI